MKRTKRLLTSLLMILLFSISSCRLGEALSEADPETEAEVKKQETNSEQ